MSSTDPLRWKALAVVCAAFFMTVLDVSIVNVALPSIGTAIDFSRENLQWVITAYAITFGGFLLLGGVWPTSWAGAACSSPASWCSRSPRSSAASPGRKAC